VKAIILAAGRGSRMKGLTDDCPKCLVEVYGKPLLEWQLQSLRSAGVDEIAIVTGYSRELLTGRGVVEFHNDRWSETNMVTSLSCAREWLALEPCIVSYSDIIYMPKAVRSLIDCKSHLAVTYDPDWKFLWESRFDDPLDDAETFRLNHDGSLAEIGNVPSSLDEVQGQYMGLLRFTPGSWAKIEKLREGFPNTVRDQMHMTGTLQKLIELGNMEIFAIPYHGRWCEVDSADDLIVANKMDWSDINDYIIK